MTGEWRSRILRCVTYEHDLMPRTGFMRWKPNLGLLLGGKLEVRDERQLREARCA